MSKFSTIIGVLLGITVILMNIVDTETGEFLAAFLNWKALLVVLGGTFAAAFINYPFSQMICFFKGFGKVFVAEPVTQREGIEQLLELSKLAHSNGLLELEKHVERQNDRFLQFSLSEMLIYREDAQLLSSLNNHLNAMKLRHLNCQDIFNNMATYAPAFGMMGTVMGLILMMTSQLNGGDASAASSSNDMLGSLLTGMGLALVTTFYGVLMANLIFTPMAGKLGVLSDAEMAKNEIIMQGIIAIKNSMPTSLLKEYMLSNLSYQQKLDIELTL